MKKLAVFDIDGTFFRSSLFIELVEKMIAEGVFPKTAHVDYLKSYTMWQDRKGTYEEYILNVIKIFNSNIKGVSRFDFTRIANDIVFFHKSRVYTHTRDLIKKLKKENYYLLAISHSPKIILDLFCAEYGFDKIYGYIYEFDRKEKFTGKAMYQDLIPDKKKILLRAIEKEGLSLKNSIGVGDTESDIKFLKLVENPICFNPTKKLYNHAIKNKWKIIVERKNVIYKIN